ncbi:MAG: HD domain-containing phosphohydrolase [Bacillota bacterium]|nr:HD domain-containing phosphohydrolase [Bacillota bacterium]
MTEMLTAMFSRHQMHVALPELAAAANAARPLALLLLKLRDFPLWQQRLTPLAADRLLEIAAGLIVEHTPATAVAARWNNATFALLLPRMQIWQAEELAVELSEHARQAVLPAIFEYQGLTLDFISGAATLPPHDFIRLSQAAERQLALEEGGIFARLDMTAVEGARPQPQALISLATSYLAYRDDYLRRHAVISAAFASETARRLGMDERLQQELRLAAAFCDIALIETAGAALHKPGPLTLAEWRRIKRHPECAAGLCRSLGLSDELSEAVFAHHEALDGSGYPRGLRGAELSGAAAILGAAQAYAALLLPRPYRPARKPFAARAELGRLAGRLWPERVVRQLLLIDDKSAAWRRDMELSQG